MNTKETLWFVGKCLSLSAHSERAEEIKKTIDSGNIDWHAVVYQSSNQLVLPAFYLNLKHNQLLEFLPEDLVIHLEEITNQNRERNRKIMLQTEQLTEILHQHGLNPVLLKGTAHLFDGLYVDIAERMLSDIDILLEKEDAKKAFQILMENGYSRLTKYGEAFFDEHRHFVSLIKEGEVAAVEIHHRMLEGKYDKKFNWQTVRANLIKLPQTEAYVLSDSDLILHNIMNVQMNDSAKAMHKTTMRQSYDLMLLSKRQNPLEVSKLFGSFFEDLNAYIALSADLLDYPKGLVFEEKKSVRRYIRRIHLIWTFPGTVNFFAKSYFLFFRFYRYVSQFLLFFISASVRRRIVKSLSDPMYYGQHWSMYKKWFS
ncbi:MAG TPA: hypothetical protein DCG69_04975 [Bacteroidales bacterium]|nr:hypothetical protein [Bacteroidales bacterium]